MRWGWGSSGRDQYAVATSCAAMLFSYLSLATGHGDVDETADVRDALLRATLGGLLLLLWLDLYIMTNIAC